MKLRSLLFCVISLGILIVAGTAPLLESKSDRLNREAAERRRLSSAPSLNFKKLGRFPKRWDNFITDNFGFRNELLTLSSAVNSSVLGDLQKSGYFRGKDGWYFRADGNSRNNNLDELHDMLGKVPFDEQGLRRWSETISERAAYARNRGANYIIAVAPRKSAVYPEYLPDTIRENLGNSRASQLKAQFADNTTQTWVDLPGQLIQAKAVSPFPLYYRTDSHWNFVGAYYAYRALAERAGIPKPYPIEFFKLYLNPDWHHRGFRSETGLTINEPRPSLFPPASSLYANVKGIRSKNAEADEGLDRAPAGTIQSFAEGGIGNLQLPNAEVRLKDGSKGLSCRALTLKNPPPEAIPVILLIGDSFLEKAVPFFTAHAKKTYYCRQILAFNPPEFDLSINEEIKPNVIIQSFTESYLLRPLKSLNATEDEED